MHPNSIKLYICVIGVFDKVLTNSKYIEYFSIPVRQRTTPITNTTPSLSIKTELRSAHGRIPLPNQHVEGNVLSAATRVITKCAVCRVTNASCLCLVPQTSYLVPRVCLECPSLRTTCFD